MCLLAVSRRGNSMSGGIGSASRTEERAAVGLGKRSAPWRAWSVTSSR